MILINKLKESILGIDKILKNHIIELALIFSFTIIDIFSIEIPCYDNLFLMGAFFAFAMNNVFKNGKIRLIYYLSWIPFIALSFIPNIKDYFYDERYSIILGVICPLFLVLFTKERDKIGFLKTILKYIYSFFVSLLLASILMFSLFILAETIIYFFFSLSRNTEKLIIEDLMLVSYGFIAPVLFFMFYDTTNDNNFIDFKNKIVDIILKYILSPALIIYAVILYLYFLKIIINWELPKGNIASMVIGFIGFGIVIKGLLTLYGNKKYSYFFNYFNFISVPIILIFWIGVYKRISEFGITPDRVILLILGFIITFTVVILFFKNINYYYYIAFVTFILFSINTFTPYYSSKELSFRSQYNRAFAAAQDIGILDDNYNIIKEKRPASDTIYIDKYVRVFSSLNAIEDLHYQSDKKLFGLNSAKDIFSIAPPEIETKFNNGQLGIKTPYKYVNINSRDCDYNIEGYKSMFKPKDSYIYPSGNDSITIYKNDTVIISIDEKVFLKSILYNAGYDAENYNLIDNNDSICNLFVETEKYKIIISSLNFNVINNDISSFEIYSILER